jgi:hypothetical protein
MRDDLRIVDDNGRINERIVARETKKDYLAKVESARRKIPATFCSPEVKRLFLRFFDSMQLHTHFISIIARTRLPSEAVQKVEEGVKDKLEKLTSEVNEAIDGAAALFKAHGITSQAEYDAQPLRMEVRVISALGRRYLELMLKVDQLMPMLETLAIDEVITQNEIDLRKALFKRRLKSVAHSTRTLAAGIRRRMNALADQPAEPSSGVAPKVPTAQPSDAPASGSGA